MNMKTQENKTNNRFFAEDAEVYEVLVDWERRLNREEPFYRKLVEDCSAQRVLDAACGTGRHAHMLYQWGLTVEGADISEGMIEYCRLKYGENDRLQWRVRGYDRPVDQPGTFDLVVCAGNSLALASDLDTVRRAVAAMMGAVCPGGCCMVHILNLWRLPEGPTQWQKCKQEEIGGRPMILLKGVHRAGARGYVNFIKLRPEQPELDAEIDESVLLALSAEQLVDEFRTHGAAEVHLYGNYQEAPYEPPSSNDLILVAQKPK